MAKKVTSDVLDGSLSLIGACTNLAVCSSEPANVAAIAAATLASGSLTALGGGSPSFTLGTSGSDRTLTLAAQSGLSISASGTATHIVVHDGSSRMAITTCTSQALSSGGTVDVPQIVWTAQQPT